MRIKSNGYKTTISGAANANDFELLKYAAITLGFVNGITYDVDGQQWVKNIVATYDENTPQLKVIISLINSI